MEAVLRAEGLRYERMARADETSFVLDVPALRLNRGDVAGVVGPSGCGKSTLVDLLAMLRRPTRVRRLELCGQDVASLWAAGNVRACTALRARHVGVVLQTGGLLPSLPVRENVLLQQRLLGKPDVPWALGLLEVLGLERLQQRLPAELSVGQRQRVAIARALAHRPALVLADEPTASLGAEHACAAMDLLLSLTRSSATALLLVSHDVELLRSRGVPLWTCRTQENMVTLELGVRA